MTRNRFSQFLAFAVTATLIFCLTVPANAQGEKKIKAKDLPAAVASAFQKAYPLAKIKGTSTETENGKTMYEVESIDGKINRDLLYAADGTCIEIEETVAVKDLPADVAAGLKKGFPQGKVTKAEKLIKGETVQYEMVIQKGKEKHEVVFDTKGAIVKDTKITSKAKSKEKEEDEDEKD